MQVKERSDGRGVKGGLPSRKCQTFAMCGTGSDSKAAREVSIGASVEVVVWMADLRKATKNVATDAYW